MSVLGLIRRPVELGFAVAKLALDASLAGPRAGAELEIEEPWERYSQQDARTILRSLGPAGREALAAVELYERSHRKRRSVLAAAERRLEQLSGPAGTRNR